MTTPTYYLYFTTYPLPVPHVIHSTQVSEVDGVGAQRSGLPRGSVLHSPTRRPGSVLSDSWRSFLLPDIARRCGRTATEHGSTAPSAMSSSPSSPPPPPASPASPNPASSLISSAASLLISPDPARGCGRTAKASSGAACSSLTLHAAARGRHGGSVLPDSAAPPPRAGGGSSGSTVATSVARLVARSAESGSATAELSSGAVVGGRSRAA